MAKPIIDDELWALIEPLLPPPRPRRYRYPGRKPVADRAALTGILFVLRSGIRWTDLPAEMGCGSGISCWRRLREWQRLGVWDKFHAILLAKLRAADRIDFERVVSLDRANTSSWERCAMARPILQIVSRHVEDAADLWSTRSMLIRAPHVKLKHIDRFDERIAAHLDGIAVAGEAGWQCCETALASAGAGALFTSTVRAIEDANEAGIDMLLSIAETLPEARKGLVAAFGWVGAGRLKGVVKALLESGSHFRRMVGIACCAMHRVDPGSHLEAAVISAEPLLRARALRVAGDLGRDDLLANCLASLDDQDAECRFWAAWSGVLLGDRGSALAKLVESGRQPTMSSRNPLQLAVMAMELRDVHTLLAHISKDLGHGRHLVRGVAAAGDPSYVPWLIGLMADLRLARLAGEAFSWISGADLAWLDLERKPPENVQEGPNEDPGDNDIVLEEDFGLPWPDAEKVARWWEENAHRFQNGSRYFVGAPPSGSHCVEVLKNGIQRQRVAAAYWRAISRTDRIVFDCAAPSWRQRRWLEGL